jgi:exodeoxyribonuclease VII large subunit
VGPRVLGVKQLSAYVKARLEADDGLRNVAVRGEVSNFSPHNGHFYFSLKEGDAVLSCFAWERDAREFPPMRQGTKLVAYGTVTAWEKKSQYQMVVSRVAPEGIGDAHQLFEERKRRLAAEGLFDPARKRPLPRFPFRVALVSSKRAAGALDFVKLMRERRPHVQIVWCDTSVQGPSAPMEIEGAIGYASRQDVDLIVVTRGGGSFEDLFTFSDERVVRAIVAAKHPVLAAIGHSVDQQLADYAADYHAETPSDAAERVGPETRLLRERLADQTRRMRATAMQRVEALEGKLSVAVTRSRLSDASLFMYQFEQKVRGLEDDLEQAQRRALETRRGRLADVAARLAEHDPGVRLERRTSRLSEASLRLDTVMHERFAEWQRAMQRGERIAPAAQAALERMGRRLELARAKLDGNDPEAILQKGYAIVTHAGRAVLAPRDVPPGSLIKARLARGTLSARVESEEPDGNERSG